MKRNKIYFSVIIFAVGTFAVFTNYRTAEIKNDTAELMLDENVEALTAGEVNVNYHICYHESRIVKGRTYYDCGNCLTKVYDEKGIGTYSKCFF